MKVSFHMAESVRFRACVNTAKHLTGRRTINIFHRVVGSEPYQIDAYNNHSATTVEKYKDIIVEYHANLIDLSSRCQILEDIHGDPATHKTEEDALRQFENSLVANIRIVTDNDKNIHMFPIMEIDISNDVMFRLKTGCRTIRMLCPNNYSGGMISRDGGLFERFMGNVSTSHIKPISAADCSIKLSYHIGEIVHRAIKYTITEGIRAPSWPSWDNWRDTYEFVKGEQINVGVLKI